MHEFEGGPTDMTNQPHLGPEDLAGFLDRSLDSEGRLRVETHLDSCSICRAELVDVVRLSDGFRSSVQDMAQAHQERPRRRLFGSLALGGALAASLAALVLLGPTRRGSSLPIQPVRAPTTGEGRARIDVLTPPGLVRSDSLVFTWRGVGADVYRFTLLSEDGEPLWALDTPDTSQSLPPSVALTPNRDYWWRVDATAEGVVASTGVRRLRVSP